LSDYGHLLKGDPNYGLPVVCYVCATPHKAFGLARIQDKSGTTHIPLCEPCVSDPTNTGKSVARKYLNAPELEISEGGEATTEQILALAEKQDATEH
jgi:hypothetical protein